MKTSRQEPDGLRDYFGGRSEDAVPSSENVPLGSALFENTDNLDAPLLFRRWTAISVLGAVMEQRVWLTTSSPIYPNLYVILIGHPGTGKTRAIRAGVSYINELPEPLIAPKSLTFASLVDCLVRSKRTIIQLPDPPMGITQR